MDLYWLLEQKRLGERRKSLLARAGFGRYLVGVVHLVTVDHHWAVDSSMGIPGL